ncbi:hypothetical protein [Bradyrhizobium sp. SZCCHNR1098]|uniref:hypothetical protein n=1 Tax=Bradyrhizobium sp. SZCCHNR1098 TaxID=3057370 RepID=UPI0029162000|nr:hypothetical protein [Bradyrhizobium sp. SZCCHNR1098]
MSYVLRTVGPAAYWFPIMLHTDDLAATFPRLHERPEEEQSAPKRGRPREINWDQFYVDLIVHADLDGLPSSQAECEQWAANWFMERLNKSPAVSTIREKIAPIYNHRRRTGKKAGK